ncbi:MAG: hypothetical protein ACYS0I_03605 [Planctomycetota bacterium]|jgi:hypothetical protein
MFRKFKYGKIAVVVFITALIWIWADLALDETLPDKPATVIVDESATPNLWVSFNQASSTAIRVTLSGPHTAIAEQDRKLREGQRLVFYFDAAGEKMDKPDNYTLTLLPFLQKNQEIKRRGLKVISCKPDTILVSIVELVPKSLQVQCFDEADNPLTATVQPSQVEMLVPQDWSGVARIMLTEGEKEQARLEAYKKTPFVSLVPGGPIRQASDTVEITVPPQEDPRKDYTITATSLSIALSPTLQGKYDVKVNNLNEILGRPIAVRATPDAKLAYEQQPFPTMTLYILDDDKNKTGVQRRNVVYNFPADFVRRNEIELNQRPVEAQFELIPISATPSQ